MKILMVTPYLPYPPSSGGQVRSYNLIKHLSKRHQIHLVSLIKKNSEEQFVRKLKPFCEKIYVCRRSESAWTISNILRSITGRYPFLVVRNDSKETRRVISQILSEAAIDLIHAETFYIMPQIPETDIPILLVEQTIEYKVYQHFVRNLKPMLLRPLFHYDILKLKYWEKHYWQKADVVGAVSQSDQEQMKELIPDLKTEIIPNAAGEDLSSLYINRDLTPKPIFMYQGNFSWLQNIEAAKILATRIFPLIKKAIPQARCLIAGQQAKERIGKLSRLGVEIIDIPWTDVDAVKEVYKKASIFLAPIEGPGGTRLKILGAMAAGVPVISSKTGVAGLDVKNGTEVLIARDENEFVTAAQRILKNKKKYNLIRKSAKKLVTEKYSWPSVAIRLEKVYRDMIANSS